MGVRVLLHSFAQVRLTHSSLTWYERMGKHHVTFILYIHSLEGECWGYTSIAHIPILVISLFPFLLGIYYIIRLSHLFGVCWLLASHLLTRSWDVSSSYIFIYSFTNLSSSLLQVEHIQYTSSYQKLRLYSSCEYSYRRRITAPKVQSEARFLLHKRSSRGERGLFRTWGFLLSSVGNSMSTWRSTNSNGLYVGFDIHKSTCSQVSVSTIYRGLP